VTPELEALSRRLVPLWKWRGGERWRFEIAGPGVWHRYDDADSRFVPRSGDRILLDLTDPATVGCLRALVRELRGDQSLSTRCNCTVYDDHKWTSGPWSVVSTSRHVSIEVATGETEAAALCNAILPAEVEHGS
jgi:hypothetical protein